MAIASQRIYLICIVCSSSGCGDGRVSDFYGFMFYPHILVHILADVYGLYIACMVANYMFVVLRMYGQDKVRTDIVMFMTRHVQDSVGNYIVRTLEQAFFMHGER